MNEVEEEEEEEEEEDLYEGDDQERTPPPAATALRGLDALLELMRQPFPPPRVVPTVDEVRETDDIAPWALDDDEMQADAARGPWALGDNGGAEYEDDDDDDAIGWTPPVYGWAPVPVDIDALLGGLRSVSDDDDVELDEASDEAVEHEINEIITASEGVPFPWGGGGGDSPQPGNWRHDEEEDDGVD